MPPNRFEIPKPLEHMTVRGLIVEIQTRRDALGLPRMQTKAYALAINALKNYLGLQMDMRLHDFLLDWRRFQYMPIAGTFALQLIRDVLAELGVRELPTRSVAELTALELKERLRDRFDQELVSMPFLRLEQRQAILRIIQSADHLALESCTILAFLFEHITTLFGLSDVEIIETVQVILRERQTGAREKLELP